MEEEYEYIDWDRLKSMLEHGDQAMIAKKLGISKVTVSRCLSGCSDKYGVVAYALKLIKERAKVKDEILHLLYKKPLK